MLAFFICCIDIGAIISDITEFVDPLAQAHEQLLAVGARKEHPDQFPGPLLSSSGQETSFD